MSWVVGVVPAPTSTKVTGTCLPECVRRTVLQVSECWRPPSWSSSVGFGAGSGACRIGHHLRAALRSRHCWPVERSFAGRTGAKKKKKNESLTDARQGVSRERSSRRRPRQSPIQRGAQQHPFREELGVEHPISSLHMQPASSLESSSTTQINPSEAHVHVLYTVRGDELKAPALPWDDH